MQEITKFDSKLVVLYDHREKKIYSESHRDGLLVGGQELVDGLLELGDEVEALLLEARGALQPRLDALAQRGLLHGPLQGAQLLVALLKDLLVVVLVVLDPVGLKETKI